MFDKRQNYKVTTITLLHMRTEG